MRPHGRTDGEQRARRGSGEDERRQQRPGIRQLQPQRQGRQQRDRRHVHARPRIQERREHAGGHAEHHAFEDQPPGRGAGPRSDRQVDGCSRRPAAEPASIIPPALAPATPSIEDRQREEDADKLPGRRSLRAEQRRAGTSVNARRRQGSETLRPGSTSARASPARGPAHGAPGRTKSAEGTAGRIRAPAGAEERVALRDRNPQVHAGAQEDWSARPARAMPARTKARPFTNTGSPSACSGGPNSSRQRTSLMTADRWRRRPRNRIDISARPRSASSCR